MHKSEREGTTPSSAIANILRTSYILARVSETAIVLVGHQLIEEEEEEEEEEEAAAATTEQERAAASERGEDPWEVRSGQLRKLD